MSIQFDKEIFSGNNLTLKVNFSGIKDSSVIAADLKMSVYAFDNYGNPKFSETLDFDQIISLYEHLNQISIIKDSSTTISGKFLETSSEIADILNKLKDVDTDILKIVINKLKDKDKIKSIFKAFSEEEDGYGNNILENLSGLQTRQGWQLEIENLKILLDIEQTGNIVQEIKNHDNLKMYTAGQPEKIFQNWIVKNIKWIFGVEYIKKHDFRNVGLYSEGDVIMESMDGFIDLIELKRPKLEILKFDDSHNTYYPSPDLSKTIGQCLWYFKEFDEIKLKLALDNKVKILRPRIKIIIGRTTNFVDDQYMALRMLNCNINNIEIISYDYLLACGIQMIENYK
jgi:hypothetical protein